MRVRSLRPVVLGLPLCLAACSAVGGESADEALRTLSRWEELPRLEERRYRVFTSTDTLKQAKYPLADPGNKDFNNFLAVCGGRPIPLLTEQLEPARCGDGIPGYLIAAADDGPGFVSRMVFAMSNPVQPPMMPAPGVPLAGLDQEQIKIYVDDLSRPVYQGKLKDWAEGRDQTFTEPFAGWRSGLLVSYLPIAYRSKLRVVLDGLSAQKVHYYQVATQSAGEVTPFDPATVDGPILAEARALLGRTGKGEPGTTSPLALDGAAVRADPGKTTLVLRQTGPGTIRRLELTVDAAASLEALRKLRLVAHWDDRPQAAIDVPLLALFASEEKLVPFAALPLAVTRDGARHRLSFYLPMPFRSRAQLALRNEGTEPVSLVASVGVVAELPTSRWGYLHAQHREQLPPLTDKDRHGIAEVTGRGKYVGTVMTFVGQADPSNPFPQVLNCLEGDELGEVDGEPRWQGTGTEDYFNGGWYYWNGPYSYAFSSLGLFERNTDQDRGVVNPTRWHILTDAIQFARSFRLRLEYGANRPASVRRYASVGLYYLE